jgi:hypothetical protein
MMEMKNIEFRAFLDMMWYLGEMQPPDTEPNRSCNVLISFANKQSKILGFDRWQTAYHVYKPGSG